MMESFQGVFIKMITEMMSFLDIQSDDILGVEYMRLFEPKINSML